MYMWDLFLNNIKTNPLLMPLHYKSYETPIKTCKEGMLHHKMDNGIKKKVKHVKENMIDVK